MRDAASLAAEIEAAVTGIRDDLQAAYEAREQALPLCRSAIRYAANCIRAVHRGELTRAEELLEQSRTAVGEAADALRDFPSVFHAGFVHDAQKEYAEASVTLALVDGRPLPAPEQLGVQGPALPARALGGRRGAAPLPARRAARGAIEQCEGVLSQMDDVYSMLVTVDYPDAMTGNLRRSTDAARAILERTRATTRWRCNRSGSRGGWSNWSRTPAKSVPLASRAIVDRRGSGGAQPRRSGRAVLSSTRAHGEPVDPWAGSRASRYRPLAYSPIPFPAMPLARGAATLPRGSGPHRIA